MAELKIRNSVWRITVLEDPYIRMGEVKRPDYKLKLCKTTYTYTRRGDAVKRALWILSYGGEVLEFQVGNISWEQDREFFDQHSLQTLLSALNKKEEVK